MTVDLVMVCDCKAQRLKGKENVNVLSGLPSPKVQLELEVELVPS